MTIRQLNISYLSIGLPANRETLATNIVHFSTKYPSVFQCFGEATDFVKIIGENMIISFQVE